MRSAVKLGVTLEEDVARAVRALALKEVPVYEVRSSAELEDLFRSPA